MTYGKLANGNSVLEFSPDETRRLTIGEPIAKRSGDSRGDFTITVQVIYDKPRKPVLSVKATRLLYEIAAYCRKYERAMHDPQTLRNTASDVMDGKYLRTDPEVKCLTKAGVIESVSLGKGQGATWMLTEYGCNLMMAYGKR